MATFLRVGVVTSVAPEYRTPSATPATRCAPVLALLHSARPPGEAVTEVSEGNATGAAAGMRLYLIRHARTLPSGPDSHVWPLAPEGEAQARALARAPFWPGIAALYSSPEEKALATVRPAAAHHGLEVRPDDRLAEARRPAVWLGDYDGAVRRYLAGAMDSPEGWEDAGAVRGRMHACLCELAERHQGESIAVCGHGLALTLGLGGLAGVPEDPFALWGALGFGTVAVVEAGRLVAPFGDPAAIAPS